MANQILFFVLSFEKSWSVMSGVFSKVLNMSLMVHWRRDLGQLWSATRDISNMFGQMHNCWTWPSKEGFFRSLWGILDNRDPRVLTKSNQKCRKYFGVHSFKNYLRAPHLVKCKMPRLSKPEACLCLFPWEFLIYGAGNFLQSVEQKC